MVERRPKQKETKQFYVHPATKLDEISLVFSTVSHLLAHGESSQSCDNGRWAHFKAEDARAAMVSTTAQIKTIIKILDGRRWHENTVPCGMLQLVGQFLMHGELPHKRLQTSGVRSQF